jgi:hypothetical protein
MRCGPTWEQEAADGFPEGQRRRIEGDLLRPLVYAARFGPQWVAKHRALRCIDTVPVNTLVAKSMPTVVTFAMPPL